MNDSIRRALTRLRVLFLPGCGAHRKPVTAAAPTVPPFVPAPSCGRRSNPHVDGGLSPLVRPYLVAHEQHEEREQQARWSALSSGLHGLTAGPYAYGYGAAV